MYVTSNAYHNCKSYAVTLPQFLPDNIKKLEYQFSDMADCTLDNINKKEVTVQQFKNRLMNLTKRNRIQHKEFLDTVIFSEKSAKSVNDVWPKLSDYLDFLNYTLLEHLIIKFDNENLSVMDNYKKGLETFRRTTRLCDFAEHFKDISKGLLQKDLLKKFVVVKLNKNWQNCSLQDMEDWKQCLTHTLLLESFITTLRDISSGCVSITWAIPAMFATSLVEKLETLDMTDFCRHQKIMSLTFDGVEYSGRAPVMEDPMDTHLYKDTGQFCKEHKIIGAPVMEDPLCHCLKLICVHILPQGYVYSEWLLSANTRAYAQWPCITVLCKLVVHF